MRSFAWFALLMLFPASLFAENSPGRGIVLKRLKGSRWESFAERKPTSPDGTYELDSFDPTRVETLANRHFRVWVREDYSTTQSTTYYNTEHSYDWVIRQDEVDCRTFSKAILRMLMYTEEGGNPNLDWTATPGMDLTWETMVPDSEGETELKLLCAPLKRFAKH